MNGRRPNTEPPEAGREPEATQLRVLQRTTERIAVVVNKSRTRIERIAEDIDQLLYDANAEGIEKREPTAPGDSARTAVETARPRRTRTSCHGCPTPRTPAAVRIVTEGCRRGVPYCTDCAQHASKVLERQGTPYETAAVAA